MPKLSSFPLTRQGFMIALSSPSGVGKTTVARRLLTLEKGIELSVSVTTRSPRPSEQEGREYYFVDTPKFHKMVEEGHFLEHAFVYDHHYGTPRALVEQRLKAGVDILFDIDWQGTQQLKHFSDSNFISVFLLPPSIDALRERLKNRGEDNEKTILSRMDKAADELSHWAEYDYVVVNHTVEESVEAVRSIIQAERLKRFRQEGLLQFVNALRTEEISKV